MCTKLEINGIDLYLPVSGLGVSTWKLKQVDGEVLSGRTECVLYVIVESEMKFISYFIVVDWSIYDYYIVISSGIRIRVIMNVSFNQIRVFYGMKERFSEGNLVNSHTYICTRFEYMFIIFLCRCIGKCKCIYGKHIYTTVYV